jgi:hypothetical protein
MHSTHARKWISQFPVNTSLMDTRVHVGLMLAYSLHTTVVQHGSKLSDSYNGKSRNDLITRENSTTT